MKKIISIYYELLKKPGKLTKKLMIIIIIKLLIMFAVLKVFFFQDNLKKNFKNDKERSEYIIKNLNIYDKH